MTRRKLKTEISSYLLSSEEIREIKFTDDYIRENCNKNEFETMYFFAQLGLISNSVTCLDCSREMQLTRKSNVQEKFVWRCKRPCRKEINVRSNSVFESLKVPMAKFFMFCKMWCKDDRQVYMKEELLLNKNTISSWCFHLRETIQDYLIENREMLGGLDEDGNKKIVEIDESLFFKRKYNRGRYNESNWVFGMIERGSTKCAFFPVADRSAATLLPIIRENCLPETIIMSDCWAAYRSLQQDPNFTHLTVNHSLNFVSPENPEVHTQNIENCWMHAKKELHNKYGVSSSSLEGYLYEFVFRKKFPREKRFNELILILSKIPFDL